MPMDNQRRDRKAKTGKVRQVGKQGRTGRVRIEVSAGGIVYRRTPNGVRVAFILDPYNKWTFAKGHVELGESVRQTAVREIKEEMGLKRVRVIAPLGKLDLWFRDNYRPEIRGTLIHKHVHYFLMEVLSPEMGMPQKDEKIRKVIWVDLQQVKSKSSYSDVKPMLSRMIEILSLESRGGSSDSRSGVTRQVSGRGQSGGRSGRRRQRRGNRPKPESNPSGSGSA